MQFSIIALLSLVALTIASPVALPERLDDIVARSPLGAEDPVMSNEAGEVQAFDSTAVYKDATTKGN